MLKSKTIDRICCLALVVMLALTSVVWIGKAAAGKQKTIGVGYEGLFDQSFVHTIDIETSDWEGLIATASQEEYVECAVTIDGEKLSSVGIRAKGNTSLSSVSTLGSEKYSFKIEFDHYVKGRLYNGLDKLSLNNLIYDATMMKDYLAYTLMGRMDVPSPLCSYVQITVNGEPWGLYLAVEGVEDGFMERNNMTKGELYKPDSMSFGGGRGNGRDFDFEQFRVKDDDETKDSAENTDISAQEKESTENSASAGFPFGNGMAQPGGNFGGFPGQMPEGMTMPEGFPGMTPPTGEGGMQMPEGFSGMTTPTGNENGFTPPDNTGDGNGFSFNLPNFSGNFNFGMGSNDVKLIYSDDDPDSYSNIFDNAKTKVSKKDKARLIEALRKLNSGEDIEETVYTDEVIRYLAVHDFLQNSDSYTGMMVHNYYLYEEDGQLAIIPWDYNLAFGGMSSTDGTSLVNSAIDSPVTTGSTSDRPLIAWIFEDEEALAEYHEVYSRFVSEYIESGWLESEITRVAEMIRTYVEADENSFFTAEEFDEAVSTLQSYCALRGESIRGQLDGIIPSTSAEQRTNSASLVNASDLNVTAMGSMGSGGGFGGGGGPSFQRPGSTSGSSSSGNERPSKSGFPGSFPGGDGSGGMPDFSGMKENGGQSGFSMPDMSAGTENMAGEAAPADAETGAEKQNRRGSRPEGMGMPEGFAPPGESQNTGTARMSWTELAIYAAVLLLAVLLMIKIPGHNQ